MLISQQDNNRFEIILTDYGIECLLHSNPHYNEPGQTEFPISTNFELGKSFNY